MTTTQENRQRPAVDSVGTKDRRRTLSIRVLAVASMGLGVAACGSSSAASPPPAVGTAFATRAVAACHAAYAQKKAVAFPYPDFNPTQPDTSKFLGIAQYEAAHTVPAYTMWLREMQALGQPPTGQAAWADLVTAIEGHLRSASEQQAAAQRGDSATFVKDYYEGVKTQGDVLSAADAAGVPQCAAVDR
jgi:hypothetical protein